MILQTADEFKTLLPQMRKYGCYEMSLLFLANKLTGISLSPNKIAYLHLLFVMRDWIQDDDKLKCYIKDATGVLSHFGIHARQMFIDGTHKVNPLYKPDEENNEVEILFFKRNGAIGHFVVGDGQGHVAYDPVGYSRSVAEGKLISKRIFSIQKVDNKPDILA